MNFVTWKWGSANRSFKSEHVNVLRAMLERHFHLPHKLICITDDEAGLDSRIETFPLPNTGFERVPNPSGLRHPSMAAKFPSCYRRLWMFSDEAKVLGDRLICIDIDVVIKGDITHLAEKDADFVGWSSKQFGWNKIAGGIYMLTTGSHTDVWDDFDPDTSPQEAARVGNNGSDQAWMSYKLFPPKQIWGDHDGLAKINWLNKINFNDMKLIFTNGHEPPWAAATLRRYPWIKEYWR